MSGAAAETARLLWDWRRPVHGWIAATAVAGTVHGLAVIGQAGLIAYMAHQVLVEGVAPTAVPMLAAALAAAVTLRAGARWAQLHCAAETGLRVRQRVRAQLLGHLSAIGPQATSDLHSAGTASRIVEQVEALEGYYARYLPQLWLTATVPIAIFVTVLSLDWLAAALLALAAPLIPVFMALVGMGAARLQQRHYQALTRLAGHFLDRIRGLSTLQLFGYAPRSVTEVGEAAEGYRRHTMATLRVAFLSSAVLEFFASVAIAMVAIYIGFGLLGYINFGPAEALTLFSGLFILQLAPEFFQPLRHLAQHYHDRAAALGAAEQVRALLRRQPPRPCAQVSSALPAGALRLREVRLEYPGRDWALGPLELELSPGERLLLWGPSGCGKSSLLRAIAGFQALVDGSIERGLGPVAWLGQRPFLARDSIRENIRLGRPGAGDAAVEVAAAMAGVTAFAALLPAGLDTPLGERGYGLSGGQLQRVALARVFLSEAELVLLDEPTAGLDADSEAAVLDALRRLAASGRTLVMASHDEAVRSMASRLLHLDGRTPGEGAAAPAEAGDR